MAKYSISSETKIPELSILKIRQPEDFGKSGNKSKKGEKGKKCAKSVYVVVLSFKSFLSFLSFLCIAIGCAEGCRN